MFTVQLICLVYIVMVTMLNRTDGIILETPLIVIAAIALERQNRLYVHNSLLGH